VTDRQTDMYSSQINYIKHVTDGQTDRHQKQLYWICVTDGQTSKTALLDMCDRQTDMYLS
jgi:hypothetical protein